MRALEPTGSAWAAWVVARAPAVISWFSRQAGIIDMIDRRLKGTMKAKRRIVGIFPGIIEN